MMKKQFVANFILFSALSGVPLVSEYATAKPTNVPGTGFDILLYEPFDFAYLLLAAILFIGTNIIFSGKRHQSKKVGIVQGFIITIAWFVISFLAVGQLHLSLGGKL